MKIKKYVPLPTVKLDIMGQNYKEKVSVRYQKRATSHWLNHLAEKYQAHIAKKIIFF